MSCQRQESQTPAPPPRAAPQNLSKAKVNQVLDLNAAESLVQSHLGGAVGADGKVTADKDTFKSGEPMYVTVTLRDAPKGVELATRWYDAKNKQIHEDKKELLGQNTATFAWSGKKLKPGKYRVVSYWGENIAGEHAFTVVK